MENPFESGHIKNYLLLYGSVVVIMILFFIAATLFHDVKQYDKRSFSTEMNSSLIKKEQAQQEQKEKALQESKREAKQNFRLLDKAY